MSCFGRSRLAGMLVLVVCLWGACAFAQVHIKPSPAPSPADQDEEPPQLPPTRGQLRFAEQYVKAIQGKDLKALRSLIVPKTLACFTNRTEPYLTAWLNRQIRDRITRPYTVTVEKLDPNDLPRSALFTLPVPPTLQMNITTNIDGDDVVVGRPIAYQDGRWYEAAPCPTDEGMEDFNKRQEFAKVQNAKTDALYSKLTDPLRTDLKKLIAEKKFAEACEKYATVNKVPFQTGCDVVRKLKETMTASN